MGTGAPTANAPVPASSSASVNQPTVKKFTPAENTDRRIKGLYFKCNEKFVHGHHNSCKRLFCIELLNEDDGTEPTISLAVLTGIQQRTGCTMHVTVIISNTSLHALLDSGSTYNFIDTAAADHVDVSFTSTVGLRVAVANGDRLTSPGRCSALDINIVGEHFVIYCYKPDLGSFDIVLGVQRL
jgi:hypothetical protein